MNRLNNHSMWIAESTPGNLGLMFCGLLGLFIGAECLVRGGVDVGRRLGLTSLVIGLTIVAYGTSSPELFVAGSASLAGEGDLVLGNVMGANIVNIAVMLGLAALVRPQQVKFQLLRLDIPVILIGYVALGFFLLKGTVGRLEAILFLAGFLGYTYYNIVQARRETSKEIREEFRSEIQGGFKSWLVSLGLIAIGLVLLGIGSEILVDNAVSMANRLKVSQAVIGLTIVAWGTTTPELATAIIAARRGHPDMVFGNALGSCLFNTLCVIGVASLLSPLEVTDIQVVDYGMMVLVLVFLFPLMRTGWVLSRWEGSVLLWLYAGYLVYLWP